MEAAAAGSTSYQDNSDVLDIWPEDILTEEQPIWPEDILTEEQSNNNDDFITYLRCKTLDSTQKTLFFKITGLMVSYFEGKIDDVRFQNTIKEFLLDYTENNDIIEKFVLQIYNISQEIKYIPINNYEYENDIIAPSTKEMRCLRRNIVFVNPIENQKFIQLVELSDFGLLNRMELGIYAVLLEMGFNQFNNNVRNRVEVIRQESQYNLLPAYRRGVNSVIQNSVYLVHKTYGILYHKFYNRYLKQFIDKI
jgi:hypothetical protein